MYPEIESYVHYSYRPTNQEFSKSSNGLIRSYILIFHTLLIFTDFISFTTGLSSWRTVVVVV